MSARLYTHSPFTFLGITRCFLTHNSSSIHKLFNVYFLPNRDAKESDDSMIFYHDRELFFGFMYYQWKLYLVIDQRERLTRRLLSFIFSVFYDHERKAFCHLWSSAQGFLSYFIISADILSSSAVSTSSVVLNAYLPLPHFDLLQRYSFSPQST